MKKVKEKQKVRSRDRKIKKKIEQSLRNWGQKYVKSKQQLKRRNNSWSLVLSFLKFFWFSYNFALKIQVFTLYIWSLCFSTSVPMTWPENEDGCTLKTDKSTGNNLIAMMPYRSSRPPRNGVSTDKKNQPIPLQPSFVAQHTIALLCFRRNIF